MDNSGLQQTKVRYEWIDAAKFVAICAVILDHSCGKLYTRESVQLFSLFSVSLFILLSGFNSYYSNKRHYCDNKYLYCLNKIKSIFLPYMFATVVYECLKDHSFDFYKYCVYLIKFNATPPLYFVSFYIELIIISPILYNMLMLCNRGKCSLIKKIISIVAILIIAIVNCRYTHIFDTYGGGGVLFGGSYLLLFYIGMIFADNNSRSTRQISVKTFLCGIFLLLLAGIWFIFMAKYRFWADEIKLFGDGLNPPGITLSVYSFLLFVSVYCIFSYIEVSGFAFVKKILFLAAFVGKHTLYIFMYHFLFLNYLLPYLSIGNRYIMRAIGFITMLLGPILIEKVIIYIKSDLIRLWNG